MEQQLMDMRVDLTICQPRCKDHERWDSKFSDPAMLERQFKNNAESLRSFLETRL